MSAEARHGGGTKATKITKKTKVVFFVVFVAFVFFVAGVSRGPSHHERSKPSRRRRSRRVPRRRALRVDAPISEQDGRVVVELPLAAFARGEYALELTVGSDSIVERSPLAFRVQ